jgi:hypothetical protein
LRPSRILDGCCSRGGVIASAFGSRKPTLPPRSRPPAAEEPVMSRVAAGLLVAPFLLAGLA